MKRLVTLLLALMMLFSLAACGKGGSEDDVILPRRGRLCHFYVRFSA